MAWRCMRRRIPDRCSRRQRGVPFPPAAPIPRSTFRARALPATISATDSPRPSHSPQSPGPTASTSRTAGPDSSARDPAPPKSAAARPARAVPAPATPPRGPETRSLRPPEPVTTSQAVRSRVAVSPAPGQSGVPRVLGSQVPGFPWVVPASHTIRGDMSGEPADRVKAWVERYVQAWNSNDPAAIGSLFTEDAAYHTEPYSQPWRPGRDRPPVAGSQGRAGRNPVPLAPAHRDPGGRGRAGDHRLP